MSPVGLAESGSERGAGEGRDFGPPEKPRPAGLDRPGAAEESAPAAAPLAESVAGAVRQLAARPERDAAGRFAPGSQAQLVHGGGSAALLDLLAPAKRLLADRVRADLALGGDAAATLDSLVDGFAEASVLRRALFARLSEQGGVVTGKGKVRAILGTYLSVLDREQRLAATLGLERRQKPVDPLEAVRRAVARANDEAAR